jgi:hypothetical protein
MLLIRELLEDVQYVTEAKEDGKKWMFIEGTYMVYGSANRNNRIYSRDIMEKEVNRYVTESVTPKRAFGELNHPDGPQINLERVSHIIEKLEMKNDGTVWGRSRVLNTPMGDIVRGILEGGGSLGVSTRGLGSLKPGQNGLMEVQNDFRLVTAADVVADPSAPGAFVQGIMENVNWVLNETNGEWVQETQKAIRKLSKSQLEEQKLAFFNRFLKTL